MMMHGDSIALASHREICLQREQIFNINKQIHIFLQAHNWSARWMFSFIVTVSTSCETLNHVE